MVVDSLVASAFGPAPPALWLACAGLVVAVIVLCRKCIALRGAGNSGFAAKQSRMLTSIFAGLGEACLLISKDGEILYANEGANEVFDVSVTLTGRRLSQLLPDERVTEFVSRAFSLKDGSLEDLFVVTVHPRGRKEERYLVVNAAPVWDSDGEEPKMRVVMRDETHRQETEQIRRDFVANASHELRTPLAIINGYVENLLDGVITDPAQITKALQLMQKHGERLARLVEDMLTISKFESAAEQGAESLRQQTFSCRECVESVLERLAPMFEQKKARHMVEFPLDDAVAGDRFYWDQVFFNLIENALKENKDDGRLVIGIIMERDAEGCTFRVRDNGVGIPHEHLPFIFKRFYRVAKDHSQQKVKGTGLGLSIVKRAVEAHGGTIQVESSPGMRTEFIVHLPKAAAAPSKQG